MRAFSFLRVNIEIGILKGQILLLILLASIHTSNGTTILRLESSNGTRAFTAQVANSVQNCIRALHGAAPLQLDSSLSAVSQNWANRLAANNNGLQHSNNGYGENLFAGGGNIVSDGGVPIYYWYQESQGFNYGANSIQNAGHFTQMVWKASQRSGFGFSTSSSWTYVVANYDPPGNSPNVANNVSPPSGQNLCFLNLDIQALDLAIDSVQIL